MVFSRDDEEGEPPCVQSQAQITLRQLLDKQLSTTTRFEQVEFQQGTESLNSLVHGSSGISSLQEFLKTELAQKQLLEKTRLLSNVLDGMGYTKTKIQEKCRRISCVDSATEPMSEKGLKKRRYGADPEFLLHSEVEDQQIAFLEYEYKQKEEIGNGFEPKRIPQPSGKLEASFPRENDTSQAISHLSTAALSCRKPLLGVAEKIDQHLTSMTPQDRARCSAEMDKSRLTDEVFSKPAPQVLDLHAYLKQRSEVVVPKEDVEPCEPSTTAEIHHNFLLKVSDSEISSSRLSQEEIRRLPCGKFVNYSPGNPSNVLYIKNLSKDVTETDLVALFVRYQDTEQPLLFRLMKKGRMKGQAFVTFADERTSVKALQFLNGYNLRGKPMVIEFGHANHCSSCPASKESEQCCPDSKESDRSSVMDDE